MSSFGEAAQKLRRGRKPRRIDAVRRVKEA
jgi:hypothetical protein